jgi:hypothetical protein
MSIQEPEARCSGKCSPQRAVRNQLQKVLQEGTYKGQKQSHLHLNLIMKGFDSEFAQFLHIVEISERKTKHGKFLDVQREI